MTNTNRNLTITLKTKTLTIAEAYDETVKCLGQKITTKKTICHMK